MIPLDLATWAETAVGGSMALALPVALLAGLVAFFSPCVVPLLPGYLSYATGLGPPKSSRILAPRSDARRCITLRAGIRGCLRHHWCRRWFSRAIAGRSIGT